MKARRKSVSFPVTEAIARDLQEILPELFERSQEFSVRIEGNLVTIERRQDEVRYDG